MRVPRRFLTTLLVLLAGPVMLCAQTTQPALAALDRDVQKLFADVQKRIVRVHVPIHLPTSILQQEHPLAKWERQLDPNLLQQLAIASARGGGAKVYVEQRPATTQPATTQADRANGASVRIPLPATYIVNAEFIGLLLNQTGDVLVPLHIDGNYLPGPLQVTLDDRHVTTATPIGSDRVTSLSVIRLAKAPSGDRVHFASAKPKPGSLVLLLSPTRRAARLSVWTGGVDDNAIVVNLNGDVVAIVRNGNALHASTIQPITEQLIANGRVERAQLGVYIRDVPPEDPRRAELAALGARAAALVEDVVADSRAQHAGIRRGDMIVGFADQAVEDVASFAAAIANHRGKTDLRIIRGGKEQTIAVDLQP